MGQILSQPMTEKDTDQGEDARRVYGISSMQGWRISMEDAHATVLSLSEEPKVSFFAVYDGHGGEKTAQFAGTKVHELVKASPAFAEQNWEKALKDGFLSFDAELLARSHEDDFDGSGCAATSAIITNDAIICANAGDSRTVLGRRGVAKPLSFDHKPENEGERSRINAAGGFVEMGRVNANLALSRALGDFNFKNNPRLAPEQQVVTAAPDVVEHALDADDEFVILACDGIWDCMTSQQAVEFVRRGISERVPLADICELMMEECLAPDSDMSGIGCDNMTACVVALLQPGQTKEQWYDEIADRVARGDGPVGSRSWDEIKNEIEQGRRGGRLAAGSRGPADVEEDEDAELPMPEASQLVQQLFGGGAGGGGQLSGADATSLLSRMGLRLNMHMPEDLEDEVEIVDEHDDEHGDDSESRVSEVHEDTQHS